MRSLVYAMSLLFVGLGAATSERDVRFERRYTADPCDDKWLIFRTWVQGPRTFKHGFRLNCTNAVFFAHGSRPTVDWQAPTSGVALSVEMAFFTQQSDTVAKAVKDFLAVSGLVALYYEFNTHTRDLALDIYISRKLMSRYRNGTTRFQPEFEELGTEVRNFVKRHATGIGTDILKSWAEHLEQKWLGFCRDMKKMANITAGNYSLTYDHGKGETTCSVESAMSWFHSVFFDSRLATAIKREYRPRGKTHLTAGWTKGREFAVCNITFPDGTVALQTFSSEHGLAPTPPVPTTTTKSARPAAAPPKPTTKAFEDSPGPFPSLGPSPSLVPSPSPETKNASEEKDRGETSEAAVSGDGGVVAGVLVVVLLILIGGVGLFLYRERLRRYFFRFQRVPTEG